MLRRSSVQGQETAARTSIVFGRGGLGGDRGAGRVGGGPECGARKPPRREHAIQTTLVAPPVSPQRRTTQRMTRRRRKRRTRTTRTTTLMPRRMQLTRRPRPQRQQRQALGAGAARRTLGRQAPRPREMQASEAYETAHPQTQRLPTPTKPSHLQSVAGPRAPPAGPRRRLPPGPARRALWPRHCTLARTRGSRRPPTGLCQQPRRRVPLGPRPRHAATPPPWPQRRTGWAAAAGLRRQTASPLPRPRRRAQPVPLWAEAPPQRACQRCRRRRCRRRRLLPPPARPWGGLGRAAGRAWCR